MDIDALVLRILALRQPALEVEPHDLARIAGQRDEYEAKEDFRAHRAQPELRAIERRKGFAHAHALQLAAEFVRPAVIGAGDRTRAVAGAIQQTRGAMTADIVERLDLALGIAHGDHALRPQIEGHVVAGIGDRVYVPHDLPAWLEDAFYLETLHLGMVIGPRRKGSGDGGHGGFDGGQRGGIHRCSSTATTPRDPEIIWSYNLRLSGCRRQVAAVTHGPQYAANCVVSVAPQRAMGSYMAI